MDQDTRNQIGSLNAQLALLRTALQADSPLEAQAVVARLAGDVQDLQGQVTALTARVAGLGG
jgi:hypothetical protein